MKRRILIAMLFMLPLAAWPAAAQAGTLKAVLIIEDDYDDPGLNAISVSARMDYGYISKLLEILEQKAIVPVEKTLLQGDSATYDAIVAVLQNISVKKDDILLVYFSGHGGMEGGQTFLATAENNPLYRTELENLVKVKPARLKIIITDACSSSIEGLGPLAAYKKASPLALDSAYTEIYRNLFLNYTGLLHVTAATEGEYAWGGMNGGNFTQSLVYETLIKDPKLTWKEVFEQAQTKTQEKFNLMFNMGLMPADMVQDMTAKGITGQTPRSYAMPKKADQVDIDEDKVDSAQATAPSPSGTPFQVVLTNRTGKKLTFYIDHNADEQSWSWNATEKIVLKNKKSVTLETAAPLLVFFDNRSGEKTFFNVEEGAYVFALDGSKLVSLFLEDDFDSGEYKQDSSLVGSWLWEIWEQDGYTLAVVTFSPDKTVAITDPGGAPLMSGTWKTKLTDHVEILTVTLVDGGEKITEKLVTNYYDANTVLLAPVSTETTEQDVVMLYRVQAAAVQEPPAAQGIPAQPPGGDLYEPIWW